MTKPHGWWRTKVYRSEDGKNFGTKVVEPMRHANDDGFVRCHYCKRWFTVLGIHKHKHYCAKHIEHKAGYRGSIMNRAKWQDWIEQDL